MDQTTQKHAAMVGETSAGPSGWRRRRTASPAHALGQRLAASISGNTALAERLEDF